MKIDIKAGGQKYSVDFNINSGRGDIHFIATPKSSKDLDELQTAIVNKGGNDQTIAVIIAKAIENKLKLPVEPDYGYGGAGYGLKLDLYSIAKSLK